MIREIIKDVFIREVVIYEVLLALTRSLKERAAIVMLGIVDEGCHDERRKAFAKRHNGICRLLREVLDEIYAVKDTAQVVEERLKVVHERRLLFLGNFFLHQVEVTANNSVEVADVGNISRPSALAEGNEFIGNTTEGRHHHDKGLVGAFGNFLYIV